MARQLQTKQILVLGDLNVRQNLAHAGRLYFQLSEVGLSRNLEEFRVPAKMIDPDHYKIVIFAMTNNIVIATSNTVLDYDSRLSTINDCLEPFIREIRYVPVFQRPTI
jgi:hypothetical protein